MHPAFWEVCPLFQGASARLYRGGEMTTLCPTPTAPTITPVVCVQVEPGLWKVTMSEADFKRLVDLSGFRPKKKEGA